MTIKYTKEQLNKFDKDLLIELLLGMQGQMEELSRQTQALNDRMQLMMEQMVLFQKNRFGRSSEKMADSEQIRFMEVDGTIVFFNEAEAVCDLDAPEPEDLELKAPKKKKQPGKKAADIAGLTVKRIDHYLKEEELTAEFGENGWKQLPDAISRCYQFIPASVVIEEHHIGVYSSKLDEHMIKAPHPRNLLHGSLVSPSLAAAVINGKYVNAVPLNRLSEEFLRNDVNIPRQDMAGWMIRLSEYYLQPVHDLMKAEIMESHHIHCDETPFIMPQHSKEYMWVFHSPGGSDTHPLFLYEYLGGRSGEVLEKYLSGYQGTLVTDGYQPYHTLMKKSDRIQVAGCYAHARRKFTEIIKVVKKNTPLTPGQAVAAEAVKRIDAMYHLDNMYKESSAKERLDNRQRSVKPLVDAYFAWLKTLQGKSNASSKLKEAINYSINQEIYLRRFLEDPLLPLDNNDAERSIKSFCVGKHSWHIIDSTKGAKASALLYSIAESAKANSLKPYEYFCYLLTELVKYPRNDVPTEVLKTLMPWSEELPDHCRKTKSR